MRKILFVVLLLQAAAAFAQPTVSAEISSDPLPLAAVNASLPTPAVAMARDRSGVAIAWIMRNAEGLRIFVTRLDATGHFTGPVRTIPVLSPNSADVISCSIAAAPGGNGFITTWTESYALSAEFASVGCHSVANDPAK